MDVVYEIISANPQFFTWIFGLINVLWGVFIYFNKKRHQNELVKLKSSLNLDLERRKKVFEMKTAQYEDYFKNMDAIHNRHQSDYQKILVPIINEFNASYQRACAIGDEQNAAEASINFQEKISKITFDGFEELQVIRSQTNTLRLTASDEVANLLDELQDLYESLFEISSKMVKDLVQVILQGNTALADENQKRLNAVGEATKKKANLLREQMRQDLTTI
ncbi:MULTISPECIES: hypothetical protein [Alteromonas]|uniref:Uncharacterized protein n=1 Tax=Alteromonas stellipolaris TaxID=233316 RepID=A0ABN4LP01_9ALTE|nr:MULTISPECIES: hypothetical protein [Alteromonas]AMJ91760.1 hypothetical protein AV940_15465 [Alteromonas sp. Mac2]ALM89397.1 hypothetical protein AOR13_345 [Alteromonas stellipolaris LMG 21856]AMJ75471.1 hypothetical protein AVL57_16770 [Alteromonas stellipolaris]AMJ87895.1 hypothetical protein AV939_15710 [Alteromonas sp. Mac1]ANB21393.1 hypothetical protein A6K25_08975 [Alteromonas stellipolaris]